MKKKKQGRVKSEERMRKEMMDWAIRIGAQVELGQLFDRWDRAIALAPPDEKKEMARAAILEVQSLLDIHPEYGDGMTIDDEVVIAPSKEKHDAVLQPIYVKKDK